MSNKLGNIFESEKFVRAWLDYDKNVVVTPGQWRFVVDAIKRFSACDPDRNRDAYTSVTEFLWAHNPWGMSTAAVKTALVELHAHDGEYWGDRYVHGYWRTMYNVERGAYRSDC